MSLRMHPVSTCNYMHVPPIWYHLARVLTMARSRHHPVKEMATPTTQDAVIIEIMPIDGLRADASVRSIYSASELNTLTRMAAQTVEL
eukprot:6212646-Pleurochrysis_carterae.AAC.3